MTQHLGILCLWLNKIILTFVAPPVFFAVTFLATCFFLHLAVSWPEMVRKWQNVEKTMLTVYGYPRHFGRQCRLCAAVMLIASTGRLMSADTH